MGVAAITVSAPWNDAILTSAAVLETNTLKNIFSKALSLTAIQFPLYSISLVWARCSSPWECERRYLVGSELVGTVITREFKSQGWYNNFSLQIPGYSLQRAITKKDDLHIRLPRKRLTVQSSHCIWDHPIMFGRTTIVSPTGFGCCKNWITCLHHHFFYDALYEFHCLILHLQVTRWQMKSPNNCLFHACLRDRFLYAWLLSNLPGLANRVLHYK